jgi:hypothetical protein
VTSRAGLWCSGALILAALLAFCAAVVAAELGLPLADVDAYVRSLPGWEAMIPDGVHPDAALLRLIADNVVGPALAARVAPLRCE